MVKKERIIPCLAVAVSEKLAKNILFIVLTRGKNDTATYDALAD
jgi:hypothetical protein